MGLDSVEIVLRVEETFSIDLPDDDECARHSRQLEICFAPSSVSSNLTTNQLLKLSVLHLDVTIRDDNFCPLFYGVLPTYG